MSKKHYCFAISNDFCSVVERVDTEYKYLGGSQFDSKNQILIKEQFAHFIQELNTPIFEADEISVAWMTENSSLIPSSVYESSMTRDIYLANFNELKPEHELNYNRISNLSIVNVYEQASWLKSFFVVRYPRVVIQHQHSMEIKALCEKNTYQLSVEVSILPTGMNITIMEKNELLFCNAFSYSHENDLVYYLTFTLQQLQLSETKGKLNLAIHPLCTEIKQESLETKLKSLPNLQNLQRSFDPLHHFKAHQFCV
jgi:hypothetical protein